MGKEQEAAVEKFDAHDQSTPDQKLVVSHEDDCLIKVSLASKIDYPEEQVYNLLTDPENYKWLRDMKEKPVRKVLKDRGKRQEAEVTTTFKVRFLWIRAVLKNKIFVKQDGNKHQAEFKLIESDMFKKFEAKWQVMSYSPQHRQEYLASDSSRRKVRFGESLAFLREGVAGMFGGKRRSLLLMEQTLQPKSPPPGFLQGYMRKISANQLVRMIEDLNGELERVEKEKDQASSAPPQPAVAAIALSNPRRVLNWFERRVCSL